MARLSCARASLTVVAVALSLLADQTRMAAQRATYKGGIDVVPLAVTVTDPAGQSVAGLTADDFAVYEDGVPQPLSFFASDPAPMDVVFVVDTSGSMGLALPLLREAARGLIRTLRPVDRGAVADVKTRVGFAQTLTSDHAQVERAIDRLAASGGTALYDGVYITLRDFEQDRRQHTDIRRQVMILISDGQDTASHIPADDVLDLARRLGVAIYVIALEAPTTKIQKRAILPHAVLQSRYTIRALSTDTGGRIFFPASARELPAIYLSLARELERQYQLGYVPVRHVGSSGFRRISVGVRPPKSGIARTRSGYSPAPSSDVALSARLAVGEASPR